MALVDGCRQDVGVPAVYVTAVYRSCWDDGYGVRGWKIAPAVDDPRVIASAAHSGSVSPTCVLVHDIMDHHLCGLPIGGHRNEVIATLLHAMRNRLSVDTSIDMMVDEFLDTGYCGEEPRQFLPSDLVERLPSATPAHLISAVLADSFGMPQLRERITRHYYSIGIAGLSAALGAYERLGLSILARHQVGVRLQQLIEQAESHVERSDTAVATGVFSIADAACGLTLGNHCWRLT